MNRRSTQEHYVLLASTNDRVLEAAQDELNQAGYRFIVCTDGFETLSALHGEIPQIVVIEPGMRTYSGELIAQYVLEDVVYKHTAVLFLASSADSTLHDLIFGHNERIKGFLRFPFHKGELREFIRRLLEAVATPK